MKKEIKSLLGPVKAGTGNEVIEAKEGKAG